MAPFPRHIHKMAPSQHGLMAIAIPTVLIINMGLLYAQAIRPETMKVNNELCTKMAVDSYFEPEMVVGKPWRIYYTWNIQLETKCLNMVFKNATPRIVQRVFNDMADYLEQQPLWDAATLHATMGRASHELVLFADQGPAGTFMAVPNVARDGNIPPVKQSVPLLKFYFKLFREGRFLLMVDCNIGVSSLSARPDQPPYRSEILATAATLQLGNGFLACISDNNPKETILL